MKENRMPLVGSGGRVLKLSDTDECRADVKRLCDDSIASNNFAVLDCLQDDKREEGSDMSPKCHHLVWMYKRNLTIDNRFIDTAQRMCKKLLEQNPDCQKILADRGHALSCLMDHTENATDTECRGFLTKMEAIVFSDYRLIYKFADACEDDIKKFKCGRLPEDSDAPHSQGSTIECLSKEAGNLDPHCKHEVLRIAELQSNDFHLDRPLFFACREDRERLCQKTPAGDGRVYRCLMRHRMDREMSHECQAQLVRREHLVVHDYKVSPGLAKECRDDIKIYHCRDDTSDKREFRLAQILLCLENVIHKGYPVTGACQSEMKEHRHFLMENYHLTPGLATACESDIRTLCGKHIEREGKTLHCLMAHSRLNPHDGKRIKDQCRRELEKLLQEADVGENWSVDPVLKEACQPVVESVCSEVKAGEGRVLSCLMDHIDSLHMKDDCKDRLLEIRYFVVRDFRFDPMLYKSCKPDAVKLCHAKPEWYELPKKRDPEQGPIVLPCLYRYAYHPDQNVQLSRDCLYEIRRVMRQRAASVDLQPEVEEPCVTDLAHFCNKNLGQGQEMQCLQEHLKELKPSCQLAVSNFTEEQAEHIELNYPLYKACEPLLRLLCSDAFSQDVDQGDLMQCLVAHKNSPDMKRNQQCRTAVEHFQLLSLKDFRFSFKFKEACKRDVLTYCKTVKTKLDVVACLSSQVMNDTLSGLKQKQKISKECRSQLKFELLQRDENVHLDPFLDSACKEDQKKLCQYENPGEGQMLECLKKHQQQLSKSCHIAIFNREKEEMKDNSIDYALMTTCKKTIKEFCAETDMSEVLYCLKQHREKYSVDRACRGIILKRMIEQNMDYRLNVRLKQSCISDIPKFCSHILSKESQDDELEGKVIACLKQQYRKEKLSQPCQEEVVAVMREQAQDYHLDPVLVRACLDEINKKCSEESEVEECLKIRFQKKEILKPECKKEVARLIYEGKADIQSDPLLFKVCATDLKHYCADIIPGHGRQLSCLLMILESDTATLGEDCKATLTKRVEMFEYAAQVAPAESLEELVRQVASSPARNYFVVMALCMLGVIFIGGLFCGRVTKKVPITMKNK